MNKKAQLYILSAILIMLVIYGVVTQVNKYQRKKIIDEFSEISENYETEASKVINYLINQGYPANVLSGQFMEFTQNFIESYSQQIDPKIGLIYVFGYSNSILIQNYLTEDEIIFTLNDAPDEYGLYDCGEPVESCTGVEGIQICYDVLISEVSRDYCAALIQGEGTVNLYVGDIIYTFENEGRQNPELLLVFKKEEGNIVEIYTNEQAKKKGKPVKEEYPPE